MKSILRFSVVMFLLSCGTNTDTPTAPFIFLIPINIPQIAGLYPIDSSTSTDFSQVEPISESPKPQFIFKYYVTNTEQQFVGYNLYITSSTPSLAETQAGSSAYLENGVQPSFTHLATENSTESSKIKKRRILNRLPPPGIMPFQKCEVYTFSMRAVFNNGSISNPSSPVSGCASLSPSQCEVGSSCNPSSCNTSSCTDKNACVVGTLCNPCKISGKELLGCECPVGTSPPGCNP